jgi:twitching motility protein PilI
MSRPDLPLMSASSNPADHTRRVAAAPSGSHAARASDDAGRSWLAVEVAEQGVLFPLAQAGEIFPMVPITPVAHTQPWFCGVVNLRGGLHGVVDLASFLGLREAPTTAPGGVRDSARLLALNPELRVQCALRVDQLAGLRRMDEMRIRPTEVHRPAFVGPVWEDQQGRCWQELDLAALARTEAFLSIAASPVR